MFGDLYVEIWYNTIDFLLVFFVISDFKFTFVLHFFEFLFFHWYMCPKDAEGSSKYQISHRKYDFIQS